MSFTCQQVQLFARTVLRYAFTLFVATALFAGIAHAQSITDGSTPSGIAPGSPAGSYALSDFDTVNLFNGHLDVRLDLLKIVGRGGAGMTAGVSLNPEPWVVKGTGVTHDWWSIKPGYGPGVVQVRRIGLPFTGVGQTCSQDSLFHYRWTRTAVTFKASDGTEFELWDKQSGGPWIDAGTNYCSTGSSRGTEFVTADGTSATFVSDSVIIDRNRFFTNTEQILFPTGNLMLRDGTRYRIINGLVDSIRDRNGNVVTFSYGPNSSDTLTYRKVLSITDSLNRVVSFQYSTNFDVISFKGFNGAARTITINRNSLNNALRADFVSQGVKKPSQLFPGITPVVNEQVYNPPVITSITLPDGRSYAFAYNQYAEVARGVMPTGGAIEYDMAPGSGLVSDESTGVIVYQIHRRVGKRREYANETDTLPVRLMTYSASVFGDVNVTVDQLDPQNGDQLLTREKHYFHGNPVDSLFRNPPSEPGYAEGREYRTEFFNVSNGVVGNVIRKVENLWEPGVRIAPGGPLCKARVKETTVTLLDTNQVSKQTFGYDDTMPFNNQNSVKEYDFGAPGALLRETRTTYVTSTNYAGSGVSLISLPSQISVFDGNGVERARTSFEYDNYNTDTYHAGLSYRANISGLDTAFTTSYVTRGNSTAATAYLLTNGSVTGSITSYAQYDVAGNVVKTIDGRGNPTYIDFGDRFGSPDGEARNNSGATELAGQISYAFPTLVTNAVGPAYTQFDYYLGRAVDAEDPNAVVSSGYFEDSLDRLTKIISAANQGVSVKAQTLFVYDDGNRTITTKKDLNTFNDPNPITNQIVYDGLGRTTEARQYEAASAYITVKTEYDALGRAFKTSNPFRSGETVLWTTSLFDAVGRISSVATPDNAVVRTEYSGDLVLVTDQQAKKRMSRTNALGRLRDVWEITPNDPTNYPGIGPVSFGSQSLHGYQTTYGYDALDNLLTVTQGTQTRTFIYDSLKRLVSAANPESGAVSYQYDQSGNLVVKTDARNVSTHFAYDALNRLTRRWYNGSSSTTATTHNSPALPAGVGITDEANFYYDSQSLPSGAPSFTRGSSIGRLVASTYGTGSSSGNYFGYDAAGRAGLKIQQTGTVNYQVTGEYNLAGGMTSLKYPAGHVISGHTVNYAYDSAGRLQNFTGTLGDGANRTYSTGIIYSPFGGMSKEQFGTTTPTPIYNKLFYNNRGQLAEIRAGTTYTGPTDRGWERGAIINHYGTTDNNGNLKQQDNWIPDANGQVQALYVQNYEYDSLNRLQRVYEGTNWQQEYVYDRWGNRRLSAAGTWLGNANNPPSSELNETQFETNDLALTNRLYAPGDLALPENQRRMQYDAAGNLTTDTYTGAGNREYDAENRMTKAWGGDNQWQYYAYDADGHRTRRKINGQETWQIYGFEAELLAEYPANGAASGPQKEYGFRNGQLLITAEAPRTNLALAVNGATASASSQYSASYPASSTINGDRRGLNWNNGGGWNDAAPANTFPDWLQVDFNGSKTIDEIDVFTLQDNPATPAEPTETMTFSLYGLTSYNVQYWTGTTWANVTGGSVTGNNKVWRKFTFAPITTSKIRVSVSGSVDGYSRITEVEAWGNEPPPTRINFGLGGSASASSQYSASYPASSTINGDRRGLNWNNGGGWNDAAPANTFPDWLQVDFNGSKTIDEIDVFTLQDNPATPAEPTETMTFSLYGLTSYNVQYWTGTTWANVTGGSVTGNNKVWRKFTFAPITTSKIRVVTNASPDGYSRITEVEAWGEASAGASSSIQWLVTDQLGTPRMIFDQTGSLANVKRHDYLPFGEELFVGIGGRTTAQGYSGDAVRQKFTQKERDNETGLDYFLARYYSSIQGRFTSPDEFTGGPDELYYFADDASENPTFYADLRKPQSLNKYQYSYNNPLRWVDPDGHDPEEPEPPQDPRPIVPLPPIPGAPPLVVPGPSTSTSTSQVPNDATIIEGAQKVLDTVADYTGITWVADRLRPIIWPTPAPAPAPAPTTTTPPTQNQQPLPPPAPIQSKGEVKTATRTPGGVTPGKTVSDKQAAGRLKSGGDTVSSSRAKARQVAKKASPGGQVVHHQPHRPGYRPHYHDKKHKNGHSFYD